MKNFERLFDAIGAMARRRHTRADSALIALALNHTEARLLTLLQQEGGGASQDVLSSRKAMNAPTHPRSTAPTPAAR